MPISIPNNRARYVKLQARNITTTLVAIRLRALRVISRACFLNPKAGDVNYRNLAFQLVDGINTSAPDPHSAEKNVTVDGIKNARPTMCFSSTKNPSWNLTLPANASIYRVSVFGSSPKALRIDIRDNMDEATSRFCGTLQSSDAGVMETSVACDVRSPLSQPLGLNGQIVTIQPAVSSDTVTLLICEVEVWGIIPVRADIARKKEEDDVAAKRPVVKPTTPPVPPSDDPALLSSSTLSTSVASG